MIRLSIDRIGSLSKIINDGRTALFIIILFVTGCRPLPEAILSTPVEKMEVALPSAIYTSAEQAIPSLIEIERVGSIEGDLALLGQLWSDDARIIDGRNTAASDDDYVWDGKDAILDRYVVAVFPNPPPPMTESLFLDVLVDGDRASVINGVDHWRFVRRGDRWWITELAYQRP